MATESEGEKAGVLNILRFKTLKRKPLGTAFVPFIPANRHNYFWLKTILYEFERVQ